MSGGNGKDVRCQNTEFRIQRKPTGSQGVAARSRSEIGRAHVPHLWPRRRNEDGGKRVGGAQGGGGGGEERRGKGHGKGGGGTAETSDVRWERQRRQMSEYRIQNSEKTYGQPRRGCP